MPSYTKTLSKNKYRTARKGHVHDLGSALFYGGLVFLALAGYATWATQHIMMNRNATLIGQSVSCAERPSYDYFAFCSPLHDGAACTHESRSRMMTFYEPIDYACAKSEPPKQFRFPTHREPETLEVAEINPS